MAYLARGALCLDMCDCHDPPCVGKSVSARHHTMQEVAHRNDGLCSRQDPRGVPQALGLDTRATVNSPPRARRCVSLCASSNIGAFGSESGQCEGEVVRGVHIKASTVVIAAHALLGCLGRITSLRFPPYRVVPRVVGSGARTTTLDAGPQHG